MILAEVIDCLKVYNIEQKLFQMRRIVLHAFEKLTTILCPIALSTWTHKKCASYDLVNKKLMQQYVVSESLLRVGNDSHEVTAPSFLTIAGSFRRTASMRPPAGRRLMMVRGSVSTNCFIQHGDNKQSNVTEADDDDDVDRTNPPSYDDSQISSWRHNI